MLMEMRGQWLNVKQLDCDGGGRAQARRRALGNIQFIGQLFKQKMLTEKIMHQCIRTLLGEVRCRSDCMVWHAVVYQKDCTCLRRVRMQLALHDFATGLTAV